jgi:hypothetical protein
VKLIIDVRLAPLFADQSMREDAPSLGGAGLCRVDGPNCEGQLGALDAPSALETLERERWEMG